MIIALPCHEFAADSICTTVDTAKLEILRQVIQYAKGKYTVSTFQGMMAVYRLPSPCLTPQQFPPLLQVLPPPERSPTRTLKPFDDFKSLYNWDKNLDDPSAACDLVASI